MAYKIYGKTEKGRHPSEAVEMATFFNKLKKEYPESLSIIALHIRNEGKRSPQQMMRQKAEGGFVKGASDIIIPAATSFVCEMKSINKSSKLSQEQVEYLEACDRSGAFSLVAYGYKAAWEALNVWLKKYDIE